MANAKNETVSLMIPRVPGDGDANVFVGINGKNYIIPNSHIVAFALTRSVVQFIAISNEEAEEGDELSNRADPPIDNGNLKASPWEE